MITNLTIMNINNNIHTIIKKKNYMTNIMIMKMIMTNMIKINKCIMMKTNNNIWIQIIKTNKIIQIMNKQMKLKIANRKYKLGSHNNNFNLNQLNKCLTLKQLLNHSFLPKIFKKIYSLIVVLNLNLNKIIAIIVLQVSI